MTQGLVWKNVLRPFMLPLYEFIDVNVRDFGGKYIYSKPQHADYFAISIITIFTSISSFSLVLCYQLKFGTLSFWLIGFYYFCWVGFGGRIMGASYALAHKEGHNQGLYKSWIRNTVGGHIFENWLGVLFGTIPYNFTTSHIFIHHRTNGLIGDTFYLWDLDRSSLSDFMLYLYRVLEHTMGISSLNHFHSQGNTRRANLLKQGMAIYALGGVSLLVITRSIWFLFFIYLQPFFCMTFFLGLINIGFHGFLELDEKGNHVPEVDATCIIEGEDDYFGEDDHMAHHYNPSVYYRDLQELQKSKIEDYKRTKGSVFSGLSIFELSVLILMGQWEKLADHFVDYSGKMNKQEIMALLKKRSKFRESDYDINYNCSILSRRDG